jgi:hypothetical protein
MLQRCKMTTYCKKCYKEVEFIATKTGGYYWCNNCNKSLENGEVSYNERRTNLHNQD